MLRVVKTKVVSTLPRNIFLSVHGVALKSNVFSEVLSKALCFYSAANDFKVMEPSV
jgi:hypothetical protein